MGGRPRSDSPMAEAEEWELLLLIASRALGVNRGELLCCLAFNAGDGGFLKIRSSNCFFI